MPLVSNTLQMIDDIVIITNCTCRWEEW